MNAIEVSHLSKRFRLNRTHPRGGSLRDTIPQTIGRLFGRNGHGDDAFWALKDVSFTVAPGEALGIIGPNGAGKSTILKLLSGILRPDRGTIRINGRVAALIELGAGFHLDLTGRENVYLNGAVLGLKKRDIDRKFDAIVDFAGIEEFISTPVKHYSSGMYLRLGFAVAIHTHPDLLLVDEVLAVGDLGFQMKCFEKIQQLRQQGVTIVFVSHNLGAVQRICNRVLLLDGGQVCEEGDPWEVGSRYRSLVLGSCVESEPLAAAFRIGTHIVEITDVKLLCEDGTVRETFSPGEPIKIHITFHAREKVESPVFSVVVRSNEGEFCVELATMFDDVKVPFIYGTGAIELTVSDLWLTPAQYRLSVAVSDHLGLVQHDFHNDTYALVIAGSKRGRGLIHPPHRWSISAIESGTFT